MDRQNDALDKIKSEMSEPIVKHEEGPMADDTEETKTKKKAKADKPKSTAKKREPEKATKKAAKTEADDDMVTLKELAKELKIDPAAARRILRAEKVKNPGRWEWEDGSAELKKIRALLKDDE